MPSRIHERVVLLLLVTLLGGCATSSNVLVPINMTPFVPAGAAVSRIAQVQVTDIRKEANLERTTIGGISMGQITLKPPVPELVQAVVEAQADKVLARRGVSGPQTVLCGIRSFEIATPATPLYWDINAKIELVLRVRGEDRSVSGMATERTFVWPSATLIEQVTNKALQQLSVETEHALEDLFAASR